MTLDQRILEKMPKFNPKFGISGEFGWSGGYNAGIKDCLKALEEADVVVCPSEEELKMFLDKLYKEWDGVGGWHCVIAKALRRLIKGELEIKPKRKTRTQV